jgi:hypothetical protein
MTNTDSFEVKSRIQFNKPLIPGEEINYRLMYKLDVVLVLNYVAIICIILLPWNNFD